MVIWKISHGGKDLVAVEAGAENDLVDKGDAFEAEAEALREEEEEVLAFGDSWFTKDVDRVNDGIGVVDSGSGSDSDSDSAGLLAS